MASSLLNNSQIRMRLEELLRDVAGDSMCIGEGSKALASIRATFAEFYDLLMDMYADEDSPALSSVVLAAESFLVSLKELRKTDDMVAECLFNTSTSDAVHFYLIRFCVTCNLPKDMPDRLWRYIDPLDDFT